MKSNFSLKFNVKDIIIFVLSLILVIGSLVFTNVFYSTSNIDESIVEIYYKGEKIDSLSIKYKDVKETKTIILKKSEYNDLLGDFYIEIDPNKGIRVKDITCPNHYCENQGYVKRINYPITCLPNQVYVILSNPSSDSEIIIG